MSFWSTEKVVAESENKLVEPFVRSALKHGAYELAVGGEVFLTSSGKKKLLKEQGNMFFIPPGQFALIVTDETVTIPNNTLGFISIRAGIKFQGLINVSGFHVDSGYVGKLKFAVYNAGPRIIPLVRGQRIFMLWFADLDNETQDTYATEKRPPYSEIGPKDIGALTGELASPAALRKDIDKVAHSFDVWKWAVGVAAALVITTLGFTLNTYKDNVRLQEDIKATQERAEQAIHKMELLNAAEATRASKSPAAPPPAPPKQGKQEKPLSKGVRQEE